MKILPQNVKACLLNGNKSKASVDEINSLVLFFVYNSSAG